jgi:pilus assembly protein CpaB
MNNKNKPIIMIGLAIIALFITLWILTKLPGKNTNGSTNPAHLNTQPIAVAAVDLPWGTFITRGQIKKVDFLKESLPPGSVSDPNELVGRTIIYPIKAYEPVLESRLAPTTTPDGGPAVLIGAGKRAMAIKVDKVVGVSGFIYPRHRVDVLVTLREKDPAKHLGPVSKTVLENLQVLAVGTDLTAKTEKDRVGEKIGEKTGGKIGGKNEKAVPVDVVTLEVTPEEGEKLALATTEGKIQLALRNYTNIEPISTTGITIPELLASCTDSNAPVKPKIEVKGPGTEKRKTRIKVVRKAPPPNKPFIVELVKGDKISEVKFEKGI